MIMVKRMYSVKSEKLADRILHDEVLAKVDRILDKDPFL